MQTSKQYRQQALEVLRGNWKSYVVAAFVAIMPVVIMEIITIMLNKPGQEQVLFVAVYSILFFCVFPLAYAFANTCLEKFRHNESKVLDLLERFSTQEYTRGLRTYMRIFIYAMLYAILLTIPAGIVSVLIMNHVLGVPYAEFETWLADSTNLDTYMGITMVMILLFMIPLYIWAYAIALVPYIAHEHPEYNIRKCMAESKRLMDGHKWQLFRLQMSMMWWALVAILTLGLGLLWLLPYQSMATAAFYEDILAEEAVITEEKAEI